MRIADAIHSSLWLMDQEWVHLLETIALGEGEGPEAVAARLGRPLQNAQTVTVRDGVAILPIVGPIFRYGNLFTEVSGATSVDILARDLRAALEDQQVRAILLNINSPGGQADGINEAAGMIREAAKQKPMTAYVGGMAASGAYWLAAAAGNIVIDQTAQLGSIGVVGGFDTKKRNDGIVEFVSTQSPFKRPDVMTPEGRSVIQGRIDAIADVFVDSVAGDRGVSRETVLSDFGQGGVKVGRAAIAAGMADSAGSLESTLAQLSTGEWPKKRRRMMADKEAATTTEADLKAAAEKARSEGHASGYSEGEKKGLDDGWKLGVDEGTKKERERLLAIDNVMLPGHDKLAAEAKETGMSAAEFALKQSEAEKAIREKRLEAIKQDGKVTAEVVATETGETKPVADDATKPLEERAKAAWENDPQVRDEFGEFDRYLSFRKNESRIRIVRKSA